MEVILKPLTPKQIHELEGILAVWIQIIRALLFCIAVACIALPFFGLYELSVYLIPVLAPTQWWVLPTIICSVYLYRYSKKWTGGKEGREAIRRDLNEGKARVLCVNAVDVIEVEEQEDEGPSYFVLTSEGETILFTGQYLDRLQSKGFPWAEFEIVEAPESKIFFGLKKKGKRLKPSVTREPFTYEEWKGFDAINEDYKVLDIDFKELKKSSQQNLDS